MADPAVYNDHREAADVGRRLKELEPAVSAAREWRSATTDLADAKGRPRARVAWPASSRRRSTRLEDELKLALVERDPADAKDVIVEVRQGVGGDEAALWAADVVADAPALRRAARLPHRAPLGERERGRRRQGDRLRREGRRRVLRLQVGGRHAPRAARPGDRVAGPDPHVDGDRRRDAGGRGGRGHDRGQGPEDRRVPLDRPGRPVREHDRLRGADHASPERASSSRCRTRSRSSRTSRRRCACSARGSTRPSASASRRSSRRPGARRSGPASARRRSARTTSPRTGSPTIASSYTVHRLDQILDGDLQEFTDTLQAEDRRRALEAAV